MRAATEGFNERHRCRVTGGARAYLPVHGCRGLLRPGDRHVLSRSPDRGRLHLDSAPESPERGHRMATRDCSRWRSRRGTAGSSWPTANRSLVSGPPEVSATRRRGRRRAHAFSRNACSNPPGEMSSSTRAGLSPAFQNVCHSPRGLKIRSPAVPKTSLPSKCAQRSRRHEMLDQ